MMKTVLISQLIFVWSVFAQVDLPKEVFVHECYKDCKNIKRDFYRVIDARTVNELHRYAHEFKLDNGFWIPTQYTVATTDHYRDFTLGSEILCKKKVFNGLFKKPKTVIEEKKIQKITIDGWFYTGEDQFTYFRKCQLKR